MIQPSALRFAIVDWQAAACRRTQLGFDAQRVDQRAITHRFTRHPFTQFDRPMRVALQAMMKQVLHHQHQCRGRLAARHRAHHFQGLWQARARAAKRCGHRQRKQIEFVQARQIGVRKFRRVVVVSRACSELAREPREQCVERIAIERWMTARHRAFGNRGVHVRTPAGRVKAEGSCDRSSCARRDGRESRWRLRRYRRCAAARRQRCRRSPPDAPGHADRRFSAHRSADP